MENKEEVFRSSIDETLTGIELKEQGIQSIALVENPAMMTEWLMFGKHQIAEFKMAFQEEQQIITAPVIVADLPIERVIDGKRFFVTFTKQDNMKILQKFMKDGNQNKIKLTHDTEMLSKGVNVFEVFMSDKSRGILQPEGFNLSDGTIFCSMKITNPDIWAKAKSGEIKGISLEGFFDLTKVALLTDREIKAVIQNIL